MTTPASHTICVNGQPREISTGTTVAELLRQLELTAPGVAVEVNYEVVPRARHAETALGEGDQVEVVSLTSGG